MTSMNWLKGVRVFICVTCLGYLNECTGFTVVEGGIYMTVLIDGKYLIIVIDVIEINHM